MSNDCLVILNIPNALEEAVVDCLLTLESEQGFAGFPVNAYHHRNHGLSLAEQVSGRQKQISFQIYTNEAGAKEVISRLRQEFSGAGLQYWLVPILENNEI